MRRVLPGAVVLLAVLAAPPARAQVSLGVRTGYGLGLGGVGGELDLGDWVDGQLPVQLDVLYRVNPRLSLGAFFSYGFGRTSGDLDRDSCQAPGADCSASVLRTGVQGTFALPPLKRLLPWVGAGLGFEWNRFSNPAEDFEIGFEGWEYLSLQGGADLRLGPRLVAGPFLLVSLSQYGASTGGDRPELDVEERALHAWLMLGVRGRFDL